MSRSKLISRYSLNSNIRSYETSLKKEPEQIIVNAETSDIKYHDIKYSKNVKMKMVSETCKTTKLCFSSMISQTDIKNIDDKKC